MQLRKKLSNGSRLIRKVDYEVPLLIGVKVISGCSYLQAYEEKLEQD